MKKTLIFVWVVLSYLTTPVSAQSLDQAIQTNAKTNVTAALVTEDGYLWVTNGINPDAKGLPVIQKWDKDGQILWEKTLNIDFTYFGFKASDLYFLEIIAVDQHILIPCNVLADFIIVPMLILLDNEGNLLNQRHITPPFMAQIGAVTSIFPDQLFPIVYSNNSKLYRLDSFDADPVSLGINTSWAGIAKYGSGQILVGLSEKGVIKIDPLSGIILDTLHADIAKVNFMYLTPENNLLLAGSDELILLDDMYNVIAQQPHNLEWITGGFFDGQTWFLNNGNGVHRFDQTLQYLGKLEKPTSDANIKSVVHGENHHWAIGNESFNAFRMPLQFDGTFEPPIVDAALTWLQAEKVELTYLNFSEYRMTVEGVQLSIQNNGPDTLNSIVINWNLPQYLCLHDGPYLGYQTFHFLSINDLKLPPGVTTIISQNFDTTYNYNSPICMDMDLFITTDLCFELSIPNQRLDANNENDRACLPITFIPLTSAEDPSISSTILTFPNPFSSSLTITGIPVHCSRIEVYDGLGRIIQTLTPAGGTFIADFSDNNRGMHYLVFRSDTEGVIYYETLIKE